MKLPCEYVVRSYLPQLRARTVRELVEKHGWSITGAAKALRISPTAASKYKRIIAWTSSSPNKNLSDVSKILAEGITKGEVTPEGFIETVCSSCMKERVNGNVCKVHRAAQPELKGCKSCFRAFQGVAKVSLGKFEIVDELREALELLSIYPSLGRLMPEVRTNIVMCTKAPKGPEDVAAFPGRLTFVGGSIRAFSEPEFNASKHMSSVLLAANSLDSKIRSSMCIRYDEDVEEAIKICGLRKEAFNRSKHENVESFIKSLRRLGDVIVDKGGVGIEPVAYVFGNSALDVARKVIAIANNLSGSKA